MFSVLFTVFLSLFLFFIDDLSSIEGYYLLEERDVWKLHINSF